MFIALDDNWSELTITDRPVIMHLTDSNISELGILIEVGNEGSKAASLSKPIRSPYDSIPD